MVINSETITVIVQTPPPIRVAVTSTPNIPVIVGLQGPAGAGGSTSSASVIDITYESLKNLRDSGGLIGQEYRIIDFYMEYTQDGFQWIPEWDVNFTYQQGMVVKRPDLQYQWVAWRSLQDNNTGNIPEQTEGIWWERAFTYIYRTPVEPIIVKAVSNSEISPIARSEEFPNDEIYYDINSTGKSGISPKGWIEKRVDKINNIDVPFDFRNLKFIAFGPSPDWIRAMYPVESGDEYYAKLVDALLSLGWEVQENVFVSGDWWNSVIRGGGFRISIVNGQNNFFSGSDNSNSFVNINANTCNGNFGESIYGLNVNCDSFSNNNVTYLWMVFFQGGQIDSCNLLGMYYSVVSGGYLRNCNLQDVHSSVLVFDSDDNADLQYVKDVYEVRTKKYYKRISRVSSYVCGREDKILLVDASSSNMTITLMDIGSVSGNEIIIRRIDSSPNTVTIQGYGGQVIEGQQSYNLLPNEKVRLLADETGGWWVI